MLEASVPRVHRWARLATAEAEMKTTFLFVTENMTALTTGSARAGGIQAFKSDQFAQNQSGLKVTLRTGGCAPGKRRSPLRTPRRSPSLHWPVFTEMKDLLTLVPPLVGLKGNLEMTLASRLSTAANTGQIDDPREQYRVVSSNLALVQVQAAVVGLLAAVAALLLGLASGQGLDVVEAQVLCASSVLTASLAACALGTLMVCIVVGARKLGVNPDNIATPIAASLGDLITLSLLAVVSSFFYRHRDSQYLTPLVCVGFAALTPACVLIAKQNPPVVRILKFGWFPIVLAMLVSSLGGLILNKTLSQPQFRGMAVFAPIMCVRLRCTGSHPGGPQVPLSICRGPSTRPHRETAGQWGAVKGAASAHGLHLQAPLPRPSSESSGAAQAVGLHPGRPGEGSSRAGATE
ncbi:solute carrier family 41 member 3 isoform X4 [Bos taurus]|uniref:solute carrier family 41 member 3 isoform X4 n=1 Tax=Bos taurus TaxID=9913 RepID=UPI000D531928|nr:solute carrier family 41 member 3 isoform X4 [Bos taurus]